MTDNPNDDVSADSSIDESMDVQTAAVNSNYKVLGQLTAANGVGVLGQNDAGSGTPIGVQGAVPNNPAGGYGLYTPHNARIGQTAEIGAVQTDTLADDGSGAVTAGASVDLNGNVLQDGNTIIWDGSNGFIPDSALQHDSVTVAGNTVSLGGSTGISHGNLSGIGSGDHHTRPAAGDGLTDDADTFNIEPADFAGSALTDDGSNNLAVATGGIGATELNTPFADLTTLFGAPVTAGGDIQSASGNALTFNTDGGSRVLVLGIPTFDGVNTAGGNVVAGHLTNAANDGAVGIVIGGGGNDGSGNANQVYDHYGTIGGGQGNQAGTTDGNPTTTKSATVSGGDNNTASGTTATVGGGQDNSASSASATVGGGDGNTAGGNGATVGGGTFNEASAQTATVSGGNNNIGSSDYATVGGGSSNEASGVGATNAGGEGNSARGNYAIVPGGRSNAANGKYSLAAGRGATDNGENGVFVWGDSTTETVRETTPNAFTVQAGGGATIYSSSDLSTGVELASGGGSWSSFSTRTAKTNVCPVAPEAVLSKVESLDVSRWEYDSEEEATHMGPMAEAFHDAFGLGHDPERITNVDADGVALAAIQGLSAKIKEKDERIDDQAERIEELEAQNEKLCERLTNIEDQIGHGTASD